MKSGFLAHDQNWTFQFCYHVCTLNLHTNPPPITVSFKKKREKKIDHQTRDTIMQVFTQSKVLPNEQFSRAKINIPQCNIMGLGEISVSLFAWKVMTEVSPDSHQRGACIMNALKLLYCQQNLRMHSMSQGGINHPALTWIKSEVQHHCHVNPDESLRSLLLYFPIRSGGVLYQACLRSVQSPVDNTYRLPYSRRLSMQSELRLD